MGASSTSRSPVSDFSEEDREILSVQAYWCAKCKDVKNWNLHGGIYHCSGICGATRTTIPLRNDDKSDRTIAARLYKKFSED